MTFSFNIPAWCFGACSVSFTWLKVCMAPPSIFIEIISHYVFKHFFGSFPLSSSLSLGCAGPLPLCHWCLVPLLLYLPASVCPCFPLLSSKQSSTTGIKSRKSYTIRSTRPPTRPQVRCVHCPTPKERTQPGCPSPSAHLSGCEDFMGWGPPTH